MDYPSSIHEESNPLYSKNTLNSYDMNSFGSFVYAYDNIEDAKKRALSQYKAIYGYVASHMIEDDKNGFNIEETVV